MSHITQMTIAIALFALVQVMLITDKINKTILAILAGFLVISLHLIVYEKALGHIDLNVIFLLSGMMIIVHITGKTGIFQWIAIKSAKIARGEPMKILILFATFTAVVSAFLDNVTTVLLVVPITMFVAQMLKVDPFPFLISEVLASNIGGTATLIGDPPNILIGSALNLSFMDFIMNDMPIIVIVFAVFILTIWLLFRKSIKTTQENKERICALDDTLILKDKTFLIKCLIVLAVVIFLFLTHSIIDIQPAAVAMMGAAVLMLITKQDVGEVLKTVEWETIFFFIGLFILVGSLVETGFITMLAERVIKLTHGNVLWTTTFILWMSAFLSAFVDNIPYVATMLPLIKHLNHVAPAFMANGLANNPLIWALSLGACLGGNGTIIGASANVITFGMVQKEGIKVSFMKFLIYGLPIMIESILICHLYIYLRYIH